MKHLFLILLAVLMPLLLCGQQKLFETALKKAWRPSKGQFYTVSEIPYFLSKDNLIAYCKQHDYIVRSIRIDQLSHYKYSDFNPNKEYSHENKSAQAYWYTVWSFEFLPKDEIDYYLFGKFFSSPSYNSLALTGMGYFFNNVSSQLLDKIEWKGEVVDGMIKGDGVGYMRKGDKCYFLSGKFLNGYPKGAVTFTTYDFSNDNIDNGITEKYSITFGEMSDGMAWVKRSYDSKYGFVNSKGEFVVTDKYDKILKPFHNGRAEVVMNYGTTDNETNCSTCSGRGAVAGCSTCGGDGYTGWSDDVKCSTCNGTGAHKCSTCNGKGRVKVKGAPISKEIVIDKNGRFVDYSDHQKAMDEAERIAAENAERARQQRIQDSLDRVEQLRLEAEAKKAELERLVAINCDYKLWSKGDHICYVLPDGYYEGKLTCGTLEEWNENRSKAQIKIVTSPSNSATYNGELLQKNNTFWISTQGTKWHLALEGEFEASLTYDNSVKGPDVIYRDNPSSSSGPKRYDDCSTCKGSGKKECYNCGGDGYSGWSNDEFCTNCHGTGMEKCYKCHGTGRQ